VKVGPDAPIALDQEEIQRRRNLVRTLFNDFWNGAYEKPVAFVDRLDQAEDYLNECLAASGEFWRLDAKTRVMLGLPPRSNPILPRLRKPRLGSRRRSSLTRIMPKSAAYTGLA
jgi:hypothetical protein